jgi:signal transduction histidine kinase
MKELDLLKKDWQKSENSFEQVSEIEIYKMIHKKSSSIVKWILIISILEVLLWTCLSVCFDSDEYLKKIKHGELIAYFEVLTYFNYAVILIFIYLFYKNYIRITTTSSTKQLMQDILKTRKTVQYYVWYNLAMLIFSLIIGFVIAFAYNPEMVALKNQINANNKVMAVTIAFLSFTSIVFYGLFWLFYRVLYGILLRRLYANYKELKKIDL